MNKYIRKYARQIYAHNAGKLILGAVIYYLFSYLPTFIPLLLGSVLRGWGSELLTMFITVLVGPFSLGLVRLCYLTYLGQKPGVSAVFYYYGGGGRFIKAWCVSLLLNLPAYIQLVLDFISSRIWGATLINLINRPGFSDSFLYNPGPMVGLLLFIIAYSISMLVFTIYWSLHVMLMPYIFVRDEDAGSSHIMKESFRLMKGNCGRYFVLLMSFWPIFLLLVIALIIIVAVFQLSMGPAYYGSPFAVVTPQQIITNVSMYGMLSFFEPYFLLAIAALADTILSGKMEDISYRAKVSPPYTTWERLNWEVEQEMQGGFGFGGVPPYGQQPSYGQQFPYGQQPSYGQQPPYVQQAPYGGPPPQTEEQIQESLFLQAMPMNSRIFLISRTVPHYSEWSFRPLLAASDVYEFLRRSEDLLRLADKAWEDCAGDMGAFPQWAGHYSEKAVQESIRGSRIRVTACIQENSEHVGYYVSLRVEISPRK